MLGVQAVTFALAAMFDDGDLTPRERLFSMTMALADVAAVVHVL